MLMAVRSNLDRGAVELIDFDKLSGLLMSIETVNTGAEKRAEELRLIKDDYRLRIAGMLKAMTVCRSEDDDLEILSRLSGPIDSVHAEELIKMYRRTAARFRDRFPASFKYTGISSKPAPNGDWMEHKI